MPFNGLALLMARSCKWWALKSKVHFWALLLALALLLAVALHLVKVLLNHDLIVVSQALLIPKAGAGKLCRHNGQMVDGDVLCLIGHV